MRENSLNRGYLGKKALCGCCGTNEVYTVSAEKIFAHNGYGYMCEECLKKGVETSSGIFTQKHFIERQAKKDASHGVKVSFSISTDDKELRKYLLLNYPIARIGHTFDSTAKIGTWQLSKVSEYIRKEYGKDVTARASKDGYTLSGSPELIIKAVRDISSNHGQLTDRIKNDYGFKKVK